MRGKSANGFRLTKKRLEQGVLTPELKEMHNQLQRAKAIADKYKLASGPQSWTDVMRKAITEVNKGSQPRATAHKSKRMTAPKPSNEATAHASTSTQANQSAAV